jgi:signal transduction histidine kinase
MAMAEKTEAGELGATILVVDDNEANRLLARDTLESEGYTVIDAEGGARGVELFNERQPDCVLLDVRMPGVDGFAACEKIRALPAGRETPIIFLTALRDVDTFDRALQVGGDDFLGKPVRPAELVVRVKSALKLRRLSSELQEHYSLLKHQRDDLMRLQLQKERLIAFVVHDLKSPVNNMDLHAQLLLRDKSLPTSVKQAASEIRAEAMHLNRLILNLLDLSKGDEGKLTATRRDIDLRALVAGVLAELALNAEARQVTFVTALEVEHLLADEDLMRRLLANLVENAIRHAPTGSAVTIAGRRAGDATELRVSDVGRGIAQELREKIFDPFVQAEATGSLSRSGRGLGLAFCRLAALAHDGRIWIEDGNPGAVFCVSIPG